MGFLLVCYLLNRIWDKNYTLFGRPFNTLHTIKALFPDLPTDEKFGSLKWSAARNGFIFLAFAAIIYLSDVGRRFGWILVGLFTANDYLKYSVHQKRKENLRPLRYKEGEKDETVEYIRPLVHASKIVLIYTMILNVLLFLLYVLS